MKWFEAAVRLEQFDDVDRIWFRVTSQRSVGALIVPTLGGIGLVYAWSQDVGQLGLLVIAALMALSVWRWLKVRIVELRVTALELVAEGDLDPATGTIWLQWLEIARLQHLRGGEEESEGLYALNESEGRVCLVPHVNEAQAGEIIHAIHRRFPHVLTAEEAGTHSVIEERSEPIALGLYRKDDGPADRKTEF